MSSYYLNGRAIRDEIIKHFSYIDERATTEDWEIFGDEETGLGDIHTECTTWASMSAFLVVTATDSNALAKSINQHAQKIIDHYHGFMLEIKTLLEEFHKKNNNHETTSNNKKIDRKDKISVECNQFLNEVFDAIQQKIRYIDINIMNSIRLYVHKLHDQLTAMIEGLYEKMIREAEPINVRECTCNLLVRVSELQQNSLPKAKICLESYALHSIRALNETAYDFLKASQQSINIIDATKKSKKQSDQAILLTAEVSSIYYSFCVSSSSIFSFCFFFFQSCDGLSNWLNT